MEKSKSSLKWVVSVSGKSLLWVALLSVLGVAMSFLSVRFAVVSKNVLDIATGAADGKLSASVIMLSLLIILQICVHIIYTLSEVRISCNLTNSIRARIFSALLRRDYMSLGSYHSGELVNRLSADTKAVSDSVMSIIPVAFTLCSQAVFSFYELFRLDNQLALVCVVAFPFVTLAARIYGKKMKPLHKKCLASDGKIKSFSQEIMQNILAVKAFVKEDLCAVRLKDLQDENCRLRIKSGVIGILANLLFFAVMTFAYYFALMWCASKVHRGIMTVGTLTAILQLIGVMQEPFRRFSSIITGYYMMTASSERLIELEDLPADEECHNDKPLLPSQLVFDKVSFAYGDDMVLEDVSAEIPMKKIISVTGTSGSGKSTFMKLIMGILKPDSGHIFARGEEGETQKPDRRLFAYVPQGNMILAGTLMENITFFEEEPDVSRAEKAAELACLDDCIKSLDNGMNSLLGEGGSGLSEGQIQRVAIARALYSGCPVLLLDEATSALDEATEAQILSNIKAMKDRTCIIITHRPYATKIADEELVFGDKIMYTNQIAQ